MSVLQTNGVCGVVRFREWAGIIAGMGTGGRCP